MKKRRTLGAISIIAITALPTVVVASCGTNTNDGESHIKIKVDQTITPKKYKPFKIDALYKIDEKPNAKSFIEFLEDLGLKNEVKYLSAEEEGIWKQLRTNGVFDALEDAILLKDEAKINANLLKIKELIYGSIIPLSNALKEKVITLTYTDKTKKEQKLKIIKDVQTSEKSNEKLWDSILLNAKLKVSEANHESPSLLKSLAKRSLKISIEMLEGIVEQGKKVLKDYRSFETKELIMAYAKDEGIKPEEALEKIFNLKIMEEGVKIFEQKISDLRFNLSNI